MSILNSLKNLVSSRRTQYVRTFTTASGEKVLEDLARFCKANESTFHPDPRAHAVAEGRREVFLRIQKHLQLSDEQLYALYVPAAPMQHHVKE